MVFGAKTRNFLSYFKKYINILSVNMIDLLLFTYIDSSLLYFSFFYFIFFKFKLFLVRVQKSRERLPVNLLLLLLLLAYGRTEVTSFYQCCFLLKLLFIKCCFLLIVFCNSNSIKNANTLAASYINPFLMDSAVFVIQIVINRSYEFFFCLFQSVHY